jgi:AcrR family transcriptional regulator
VTDETDARAIGTGRDWADSVMSTVVGRELPATAQRILQAAQRVLARDGFEALTISAIADEALQTKSLVLYHFGRRANLEALLVDSLWHDIDAGFVRSLPDLPADAGARIDALVGFYDGIAADRRLWRMYYELLPSVIGDTEVRKNLARIYESYRQDINVRCLEATDLPAHVVDELSCPFLAVGEGLPLQSLLDPAWLREREAFTYFGRLARGYASAGARGAGRRGAAAEATPWIAWDDRREALPRPAQKILRASERLLDRKGLKALTLDSIAEASGQPRSSVSYYFRGKQGLVEALSAAVLRRHQKAYLDLFGGEGVPGPDELRAAVLSRSSPVRAFFLLLPAVLHDEELLRRAGVYYAELREWLGGRLESLGRRPDDAELLASVTIACVDGVAIETLYDPAGFDPTPALVAIGSLVDAGLRRASPA